MGKTVIGGPLESKRWGVLKGALPFVAASVLAQASVALPPGPQSPGYYLASTLVLVATGLALLLGWGRVPQWALLIPTSGYFVSVGLLLVSGGIDPKVPSTAGGLAPLVLLPIIGAALVLPRVYALFVALCALMTVGVVGVASENSPATLLRKLFLYAVLAFLISFSVHALRDHLGRRVAEHAELARQADLMATATRRLTALHEPEDVIKDGVRVIGELAFPPGGGLRRASYLRVTGERVMQHVVMDEAGTWSDEFLLADHPYLSEVVRTRRPLTSAIDASAVGLTMRHLVDGTNVTHAAWLPIQPGGELHGVVSVATRGAPFSDELFNRCIGLGGIIELALGNALAHQMLQRQATTDPLTGLANRRGFELALNEHAGSAPFAVLFMDLDGLKQVNDAFGHDVGDALIVAVGEAAARGIRTGEVLARLGGDEFALFLTGATRDGAERVARRISDRVAEVSLHGIKPRVSIGIACGRSGDDPHEITRRADLAMYEAKSTAQSPVGRPLHLSQPEQHLVGG